MNHPFKTRRSFVGRSIFTLATFSIVKTPARSAQFELKCASNLALDHPATIRMREMWATIDRESGGRLHVDLFPNSQLGGDSAMFTQLRVGALGFLHISPGSLASVVPLADIGYLGFAYRDANQGLQTIDGPVGDYLRQEVANKGMFMLRRSWDSGMNVIGSNTHPIQTPDDLHGFKLRVVEGRISQDLFKTLGANPVPMSPNEVYTSLQTKIIDGEALVLLTILVHKYYEVNKYISITNHAWGGIWLIANGDVWKSLPPDLQGIIERNNTKYTTLERRDTAAQNSGTAAKLDALGIVINRVDQAPFQKLLRPYYATWQREFGPRVWAALEQSLGRKLI
jgi:TRAP-type transport system periplasmic protein